MDVENDVVVFGTPLMYVLNVFDVGLESEEVIVFVMRQAML